MLRRLNIQVLDQAKEYWPITASLLLHAVVLSVASMPHAPKTPEFLTVEMSSQQLPQKMASTGSVSGRNGSPAPSNHAAQSQPVSRAAAATPAPVQSAAAVTSKPAAGAASPSALPAVNRSTGSGRTGVAPGGVSSAAGGGSAKGAASGSGAHGSAPVESSFGSSDGPSYIHKVVPAYPRMARRVGREGTVVLRLTLDEKGNLLSAVVVEKAGHGFDEATLAAARASRYRPAKRNGLPVACKVLLPVKFKIEDE